MTEFDEMHDFVVVGSGGGSMCAGLAMRARGKSVLILEKTKFVGGTTARSGGVMWIPNNPFMRRDGVPDSPGQANTYLESVVTDAADTPGTSPERRRIYVAEAPRMVEFLLAQGIKLDRAKSWPDYYDDRPGGSQAGRTVVAELFDLNELGAWKERLRPGFLQYAASLEELMELPTFQRSWAGKRLMLKVGLRTVLSRLAGKSLVSAGAALQGRMLQAALKAGVDIRTETAVDTLIEAEGAITGVVSTHEGKQRRIGARLGVLVNAGGFARNQAMRDHYQPGTRAEWSNTAEGDTGEMIQEMMRHGAAIAQMEEMVGYQTTLSPGSEDSVVKPPAQGLTASPHAILVDQSGERYMNEGGSYMAYCQGMQARHRTVPAIPSWAIFDAQFMRKSMIAGTMPGSKKPASWQESGYLRQGATLADLASQLSINPEALVATVTRFNGFVADNHDADFARGARAYDRWLGDSLNAPNETLGAITEAPFYSVPVVPGDVSTFGGVVTDAKARVLREDGSVIAGLYATGTSTASMMGRAYPGAGSSVGPSFTWGFVAANHASGANDTGSAAS